MIVRAVCRWPLLLAVVAAVPAPLRGGEPTIRDLSLRGLQIGATTTLVVHGDELGVAPRLLLPFPNRQCLKSGSTKNQAIFDVTVETSVRPGYYQLRVVTDAGVSLPVVIAVDRLPQSPLPPMIQRLPAAVHAGSGNPAETRFAGKAGQQILIEVEAQRLGSRLRPVLHLVGPKRIQIAWAWPMPSLHGDARLETVLPDDGIYALTIHDVEYAPPGPNFFRLRIGQWSFVDRVFPPAVEKGRPYNVELLGPSPPPRLHLSPAEKTGPLPVPMPAEGLFSGPHPFVRVSSHAEMVRQAPPDKVQELPAGNLGVSARLLSPYSEHRYRVPVPPTTKALRLEVFAERYGSPLDAALVVRNDKGAELARAEDGPGTLDPVLEFSVPANVPAIVVGVVDAQGRGGPGGVYRLAIDPRPHVPAQTRFSLHASTQRITVPVGGRTIVPVVMGGGGHAERVELWAEGLPTGLRLEGADIPAGADGALVTVHRGNAAAGTVVTQWRGRSRNGQERAVTIKGHPMERIQPWLASEIALAAIPAKESAFRVDWRDLTPEAALVLTTRLPLPVTVTRPAGKHPVRLTLLTTQIQPMLNGQPDLNQTLRLEKPIELPATAQGGDPVMLVPAQLSAPVYDITVQAELLTPDTKSVLATTYAPVRRMTVHDPVTVRLQGPTRLEALLDPKKGATVRIPGQVERRGGLASSVTVTLAGLPKGARADAVTLKGGATAFSLKLVLPPGLPAGEVASLKLFGSAAPDARLPNIRLRSRDLNMTLVVRLPAK